MKFFDSLRNFATGLGTARDRSTGNHHVFNPLSDEQAAAMYRSDWLGKKIVDIIPNDMTREWRDWQAADNIIEKLEGVEKAPRISVQGKVALAMKTARASRGAIIYMGIKGQEPANPLLPESVGENDLEYLHVFGRKSLTLGEIRRDLADPYFGEPQFYELRSKNGNVARIHPSRCIRFKGLSTLEDETSLNDDWGDSILQIVHSAITNATSVQAHVAAMVPEAKSDVIYVPGLSGYLRDPTQAQQLKERFALAAQMKSMFGFLLLEGNGKEGDGSAGEKWEQKSLSFAQLPELIRQFLQIASAASDIPVTRLLGESPGGLNATGESDLTNYYDNLRAQQTTELTPVLSRLDEVVIRSATGARDASIYYEWAPLWTMTEKEKADIFKLKSDAARVLVGPAAGQIIPINAVSDALINTFVEDGSLPGLEKAIKDHGTLDEQEDEEEDLQASVTPANSNNPRRMAANDAAPRSLYVRRDVLNASELTAWAEAQGFKDIVPDLHVTIIHSRKEVDWMKIPENWSFGSEKGEMLIMPGGPRLMEQFNDATVLLFNSSELQWRHMAIREHGAEHDFPEYSPHVTIAYGFEGELDEIEPYTGKILLGPEIFEEVKP